MRALAAACVGVVVIAFLTAAGAGAATTYVVTNTNASGPGSLADAVASADANPGPDTITFAVTGTITLTHQLNITDDLLIQGPGPRSLTISGGGTTRVLSVSPGVGLQLSLVTIADASSDFYGGALANFGGHVAIGASTFSGNSAPYPWVGGAIYSTGGTLDISATTFVGNSTGGHGGAIYLDSGFASITNSTFTGNSTVTGDGAAIFSGGTLTINSTTIVGNTAARNGGAIYTASGTSAFENTLVANNAAGASGPNCSGNTPLDGGGNLQYPGSDCGSFTSADPLLDPAGLADNGGPTDTIALTPASPAVDAAVTATCPSSDQRNVPRPQGPACDTGAYELIQRPTTADQCKNGGWQAYRNFKNQGDCVSYVGTHAKNPPAG